MHHRLRRLQLHQHRPRTHMPLRAYNSQTLRQPHSKLLRPPVVRSIMALGSQLHSNSQLGQRCQAQDRALPTSRREGMHRPTIYQTILLQPGNEQHLEPQSQLCSLRHLRLLEAAVLPQALGFHGLHLHLQLRACLRLHRAIQPSRTCLACRPWHPRSQQRQSEHRHQTSSLNYPSPPSQSLRDATRHNLRARHKLHHRFLKDHRKSLKGHRRCLVDHPKDLLSSLQRSERRLGLASAMRCYRTQAALQVRLHSDSLSNCPCFLNSPRCSHERTACQSHQRLHPRLPDTLPHLRPQHRQMPDTRLLLQLRKLRTQDIHLLHLAHKARPMHVMCLTHLLVLHGHSLSRTHLGRPVRLRSHLCLASKSRLRPQDHRLIPLSVTTLLSH